MQADATRNAFSGMLGTFQSIISNEGVRWVTVHASSSFAMFAPTDICIGACLTVPPLQGSVEGNKPHHCTAQHWSGVTDVRDGEPQRCVSPKTLK